MRGMEMRREWEGKAQDVALSPEFDVWDLQRKSKQ